MGGPSCINGLRTDRRKDPPGRTPMRTIITTIIRRITNRFNRKEQCGGWRTVGGHCGRGPW